MPGEHRVGSARDCEWGCFEPFGGRFDKLSERAQERRVDDLVRTLDAATTDRELTVSVGSFGGSDAEVRYSPCLDGAVFIPDGKAQ